MKRETPLYLDVNSDTALDLIHQLIEKCGGEKDTFASELITQMIQNNLKMIQDKHDISQLKLIARAMKEIRYAYRIFNKHKGRHCVSIFGSARTPEDHPDYIAAKLFSSLMADAGWMCITGAANGIMKAGLEGPKRDSSFGLSIRLPFETPTNSVIAGDPKLISFRYFFTRKLMFLSHADALAAFPGGFGTLDELFEALTLQQTGKSTIVPIVLIEGDKRGYWQHFHKYIKEELLKNKWISSEDENLYYIAKSPDDAAIHIQKFYKNYHSSRYVKDLLVLRLKIILSQKQIDALNLKYSSLFGSGEIITTAPFPEETDHLTLPRIAFHHSHKDFGLIRALIDDINNY